MKYTRVARSVALMSGVLGSANVLASGFQLLEQNASGMGNAYAGSAAVAEDASTIYYNPAGMTYLKDREFSLGGALIKPSYKFTDNGSSDAPAATGGTGGDAGSLSLVPDAYMSWAVAKDWYVGLGIGAPFGLKTQYDDDWAGRFQSTKFEIKTININPSVAWRISDKVSVGAGLNWQRMEAEYLRMAATASLALPSAFWPTLQDTQIKLKVNDSSWGWNAGALFQLSDSTRWGISYRSAVRHKLEGTLDSNNQAISPNVSSRVDMTLPDTFITSVSQRISPTWTLLGDVSWTGWHRIQYVDVWRTSGSASGQTSPAQTLDTKFRDTWRVALGATQKLSDTWSMKYGVAYDQTPVKGADTRLVSLPDNNRIWLALGTQYRLSPTARFDLGAAYLLIRDTTISNDQSSSGRGYVSGSYSGSVALVGLQYSQAF